MRKRIDYELLPTKEIKKRLIDKETTIKQMAHDIGRTDTYVRAIVNNKIKNAEPTKKLIKEYVGIDE